MAFFGRLAKQYIEDVLVNKLSDSKLMQQVAVKGVEATKSAAEAAAAVAKDPGAARNFLADVFDELKKQASKDLNDVPAPKTPKLK